MSSPSIGDWIAEPHANNGVAFVRYATTGGPLFGATGFISYHPFPHVLGAFPDEASARRAIRSFDSGSRTVALIDGRLAELTYYADRTPDTHGYEWVQPRLDGNPVAFFWGKGQNERWPSTYPNTDDGTALRRLAFEDNGPHESYEHGRIPFGDIFVASGDVSADIDSGSPSVTGLMVFTLPAGRVPHHDPDRHESNQWRLPFGAAPHRVRR